MANPTIPPENIFDVNGDVTLSFYKYPAQKPPRRNRASHFVYLKTSSKVIAAKSPAFEAMFLKGAMNEATTLRNHGKVTVHLPEDDCKAFAFVLLAAHGGPDAGTKMDKRDLDLPTLVQLARIVDKYDFYAATSAWTDSWLSRVQKLDVDAFEAVDRQYSLLWAAFTLRDEGHFQALTRKAQRNHVGNFENDEEMSLPQWVIDGINNKRLIAFTIIRDGLRKLRDDCKRGNNPGQSSGSSRMGAVGKIWIQNAFRLGIVESLGARLGISLYSKPTMRSIKRLGYEDTIQTIKEVLYVDLWHVCSDVRAVQNPTQCIGAQSAAAPAPAAPAPAHTINHLRARSTAAPSVHPLGQALPRLWTEDLNGGSQYRQHVDGGCNPVKGILQRLKSRIQWQRYGSNTSWGFGLGDEKSLQKAMANGGNMVVTSRKRKRGM